MSWIARNLWLIPFLPLVAAAISAVLKRHQRKAASSLALGSMAAALVLSLWAFANVLAHSGTGPLPRQVWNFTWFSFGDAALRLGWVLDPLTVVMLVMVSLVGLLIFIYSLGYMAHDENFVRFFCFLALFGSAMLGLVIANSLLLLFICWELVGLTSYLLIGFWYHRPAAAAAAKKAFITTRIGDLAFLLGMVWLYSQAGTLLFYDAGHGCLEQSALTRLVAQSTRLGLAVSTGIGLLIFCGAIGKSGQVPLHVWLPDAMEGPTPVSALIHAATMVAAGVFLVARMFPLMAAHYAGGGEPATLTVIAWVGAFTAIFAATIAVAQDDIKRILAYSTVSQLGFMMLGLAAGGLAVGMFHLITHAFFKALLFLGAGSVIHACREQQDIRCLGGLRRFMPVTFATYAIGMMALSGVPLFFSGFWSKDEILGAAHRSGLSGPFFLATAAALLTAFYMTRQVFIVFFGNCRLALGRTTGAEQRTLQHAGLTPREHPHSELPTYPHESPTVMTLPLLILAFFAAALGFINTPAWPWFQAFLEGEHALLAPGHLLQKPVLPLMCLSGALALTGIAVGWWFYGRQTRLAPAEPDPLEQFWPNLLTLLRRKYFVDEIYDWAVVGLNAFWARACAWLDLWLSNGLVLMLTYFVLGVSWLDRLIDQYVINLGFDESCKHLSRGGGFLSAPQKTRPQNYFRLLGVAVAVLVLILVWGCRAQ